MKQINKDWLRWAEGLENYYNILLLRQLKNVDFDLRETVFLNL